MDKKLNVKIIRTALSDGVIIPLIGFGTWRTPPESTIQAITDAIEVGFRHIDCALIYGNEREVGKGILECMKKGVIKSRNELFITGKLWNTFHTPSVVRSACMESIHNLGAIYLDCYLMHWPMAYKEGDDLYPKDEEGNILFSDVDYVDTWRAMEALVDEKLCRTIGLSNFNKRQIERILSMARIKPTVLQVECHPFLNQNPLMEFCGKNNILLAAYSPLGSPHSPYTKPGEFPLLQHPTIIEIAKRCQRTPAQILLRYQLQRCNLVIVRSITKEHMIENLQILDFTIKPKDMVLLESLNCRGRFMIMDAATNHIHHPFENDLY